MIFLFKSSTCKACTQNLVDKVMAKYPDAKVIDVKPDKNGKLLAYENDIQLGDESPVTVTPSIFIADTNELYTGLIAINRKLEEDTNVSQ